MQYPSRKLVSKLLLPEEGTQKGSATNCNREVCGRKVRPQQIATRSGVKISADAQIAAGGLYQFDKPE